METMSEHESLGSFIKDNKTLLKDYLETRFEIFRLSSVRLISKSAGYFVWVIISLFLFFLIVLFSGLAAGFWLSELLNSHAKGFGIIVLFFVLLFGILAFLRKKLFVEPFIQLIIKHANEELEEDSL